LKLSKNEQNINSSIVFLAFPVDWSLKLSKNEQNANSSIVFLVFPAD